METCDFLSPALLQQNAAEAGLEPTVIAQLIELAARVAAEPAWRRCAEQLYAQTYLGAEPTIEPSAEALLGEEANKLYLLLAVDAVRQLRAVQQARGVPAAVTREIFGALPTAAQRYAQWHGGKAGIEEWVLRYWFCLVASGDLYRLGRMEYVLERFEGNLRLYRHKQSGRVQALAEDGIRFTADGYLPYEVDVATDSYYGWSKEPLSADEGWTARLVESEASITGTPISPYGYALPTAAQLAKDEWELVLCNGDTVLDMHIPNFMPLTLELLHDSFKRALDFFPRYHPERPFKAFACSSWIFNTQWVEMLPANSNLLAFQRQGYLFPLPSDGGEGLYFIFGEGLADLEKVPQETRLQRVVVKHLQQGGKLRNGGFLLLPDAVEQFGQEPYRKG